VDFYPKEAEMKYCGIDLHSNNSVVMVSDEKDRIVLQKRLPNELGQIRAALEPHREELVGVVIGRQPEVSPRSTALHSSAHLPCYA
jgi:hypothetical protein